MKGKYAARATNRREATAGAEQAAAAGRALARAEAAHQEDRDKAGARIARLEERLAEALAQRDSAASPRVAELEARNAELSALLADAKNDAEKMREKQGVLFHFTAKLLHNITGCTGLEAIERLLVAIGADPDLYIADKRVGVAQPDRHSRGEVQALQRVRGWRSSPKVIEHLDSLIAAARERVE